MKTAEQQQQIGEEDVPMPGMFEEEPLDMAKHGSTVVTSGKPVFDKLTPVVIVGYEYKRASQPKKDTSGNEYHPVRCILSYSLDNGKQKINEGYGGIREYPDRWYAGPETAFGRLQKILKDTFEYDGSLDGVKVCVGKIGVIKTETGTVSGTKYTKNMIQHFLLS